MRAQRARNALVEYRLCCAKARQAACMQCIMQTTSQGHHEAWIH